MLTGFIIGGLVWMPLGLALGALIRVSRDKPGELADISKALRKDATRKDHR